MAAVMDRSRRPITAAPIPIGNDDPASEPPDSDEQQEARNGPTVSATSRPDPELANMVRNLFYQAREYRRPLMSRWRRAYSVLNNQIGTNGLNEFAPNPRIPKVWPICASLVAWMTDQRPILQVAAAPEPFSAYGDFYQMLATDMNVALKSSFMVHKLDAELSRLLWDVATYGIGWVKTGWEPYLAEGLGDAAFRRVDPFTIYPDPFARNPESMNFIIEAKTVTLEDLDRAFPGAAGLLANDQQVEPVDEAPHALESQMSGASPRVNLGPLSPSTTTRYAGTNRNRPSQESMARDMPVVTVLEGWIRQHRVETDDDNPEARKVIDEWRCIVVVGNLVLFDHVAGEINAFSTHPYDRCVLFDTGEMYGPSLVYFLSSPQESINRVLAAIEHNVMLMGNPVLLESPRSQSRQQAISNRPGQRIKGGPLEVSWLAPPQMHPQMSVSLISYYESQIETVSGLSAIVRGFSPTGRNSQGVLDSVQDAAFVRIRATMRELERTLRGAAEKMASTIAEFYTEPRFQSLIGDDGMIAHAAFRARHFYTHPDESGQRIPLRFTLIADAGSSLPTSQQARAGDAMTLFGMGAIDQLELLKAMNWPNYAVVAKRVLDNAVATAAAQAAGPGQRAATRPTSPS